MFAYLAMNSPPTIVPSLYRVWPGRASNPSNSACSKSDRGKMADRSGGLWIVTFLILGLFVAVAAITPSTVLDLSGPGGDGGTVREGVDYQRPALRTSVDEIVEGEELTMRLTSQPARGFLMEGGRWIWTFGLEGGLAADEATIRYGGDRFVAWMSSPGAITGFGPASPRAPAPPCRLPRSSSISTCSSRGPTR